MIQLSSAAVYGNPTSFPVSEDAKRKPISPYGIHKVLSEDLAEYYYRLHQINTCSLRIFSIFGPDQRKLLFWDLFQKTQKVKGNSIELFGTGGETRDYIFIDDFITALENVIECAEFRGEKLNVASGKSVTIKQAAKEFLNLIRPDLEPVFSGHGKAGDPARWQADIGALISLGYSSTFSFADGLVKTLDGFRMSSISCES